MTWLQVLVLSGAVLCGCLWVSFSLFAVAAAIDKASRAAALRFSSTLSTTERH